MIKDETSVTGNSNTSAINAADTTGVNQPGQEAAFQGLITCNSSILNNCLGMNIIASREIGSDARLWAATLVSRDRSGVDSNTSGGAQLNMEQDLSADYADDGLNTTVWGGIGNRYMDQWVFSVAAPNSITIQAQIVGTALTLNTAATLPAGTILHGQPTGLAANTTVVSETDSTHYNITPSQNVTGEQMSATPPSPTSASFAGGLVAGVGAGTSVDSLILASAGSAGTGSQIANMLDSRNIVPPAGSGLAYSRSVIMASNQQIEFNGDGANTAQASTPSLLSPPERTLSYSAADAAWEYFINGLGVAFAVQDSGMTKANLGLTVTGKFIAPFVTPASSSAACTQGQQEADASYLYVCVTANTWKRAALSSF